MNNTTSQNKAKISYAFVIEGDLYEVWGEDSMITTFSCQVGVALWNGGKKYFLRDWISLGHVFDEEEGVNRVYRSRDRAQVLVDQINGAGWIDLSLWEEIPEQPSLEERLNDEARIEALERAGHWVR